MSVVRISSEKFNRRPSRLIKSDRALTNRDISSLTVRSCPDYSRQWSSTRVCPLLAQEVMLLFRLALSIVIVIFPLAGLETDHYVIASTDLQMVIER